MTTKARSWDRSVVGKAAAILMTFRNGCRHTMTDIAVSTGIPPSTAHRLIKDLTASQLLERTEEGDYQLGLPIRLSATFNRPSRSIDGIAQVLLQDLSDVTGCGVRLGVLSGSVVAFVEKQAGRRPASLLASEMCAPAHATAMGKVLLAFSSKQAVQFVLRQALESYTPFTITAPDQLRRSLDMTRRTQLAVSRSELTMNRSAIAVPVFGSGGRDRDRGRRHRIQAPNRDPSSDRRRTIPGPGTGKSAELWLPLTRFSFSLTVGLRTFCNLWG